MGRTYKITAPLTLSLLLSLALIIGAGTSQSASRSQARPNVVFVLTDDQMPGTENRMPGLQNNVVSQGVKFSNTVSNYPLCCPGRAVIHRGQYPHNTKIYGNSEPLGGWEKFRRLGLHRSTTATWLDDRGYKTGFFGKNLNNYRGKAIPPGWDRWYGWNGTKMGWTSVNDQGTTKSMDRQQADVQVADKAASFLKHQLDGDAPVFTFVNFGAMHSPYPHSKVDRKKFKDAKIPRTPAFNESDVSDKNADIRRRNRLTRSQVSDLDSDYRRGLRSLQRVDRFIRETSDILRRHREMENTYFVFYTDNGAHFGQHRLPHGKLQPYEEDINFPLIVRGPGIRKDVVESGLVGNHDIAPTIADMANARTPNFVDGRSVLPLATGETPTKSWTRTAILSIREPNLRPPPRWEALRMRNEKYIRLQNGEEEYYNLSTDPYEVRSKPGSIDPEVRAYWNRRMDTLGSCSGSDCRTAENAPPLPTQSSP